MFGDVLHPCPYEVSNSSKLIGKRKLKNFKNSLNFQGKIEAHNLTIPVNGLVTTLIPGAYKFEIILWIDEKRTRELTIEATFSI